MGEGIEESEIASVPSSVESEIAEVPTIFSDGFIGSLGDSQASRWLEAQPHLAIGGAGYVDCLFRDNSGSIRMAATNRDTVWRYAINSKAGLIELLTGEIFREVGEGYQVLSYRRGNLTLRGGNSSARPYLVTFALRPDEGYPYSRESKFSTLRATLRSNQQNPPLVDEDIGLNMVCSSSDSGDTSTMDDQHDPYTLTEAQRQNLCDVVVAFAGDVIDWNRSGYSQPYIEAKVETAFDSDDPEMRYLKQKVLKMVSHFSVATHRIDGEPISIESAEGFKKYWQVHCADPV
ncbi:hypothetical protein K3152_13980 [Qipengyuania sp. 1NDH17]|uniref:Uncharacterized protein n=1 Tax=Qipengyuania polymorpha TaxID=2867234 RepID=A0ABS7J0U8_9SPHN|nr:hypothetical protein [Qipengyuania polymorpha]MBX7459358.1 hypothetical protein [Qipengyuania polymorpha]